MKVSHSSLLSIYYGNFISLFSIKTKSCSFHILNGTLPTSNSYVKRPIAHISTELPYNSRFMISGERYKGVPQ